MTACARCGTTGRLLNTDRWCQLCSHRPIDLHPHIDYWSVSLPDSGIPNHEQEHHMQRVLRWDVPVDDAWHKIGAGDIVHVASRDHHQSPGDLVEVWTLEETPADSIQFDELRKRAVTVIGTGHIAPNNTRYIGTAVVPTFTAVSRKRDTDERIVSMSGLVWHVFERYDPDAARQALAEEGRRLASAREDLIAQGHDPSELPVPLHPEPLPAPVMSIFDGPPDFEAMKDRAIKRAMREGAAVHIDILTEQLRTVIPADKVWTRDDVIALLEGVAQGMRSNDT